MGLRKKLFKIALFFGLLKCTNTLIQCSKTNDFYFLITYGVCKKRKYCNRMSEKKNSLLLTNVHDLYVLEDKTSQKKFPFVCMDVCMSVCLSVCLDLRTYVDFSCGHNNFWRSWRIQTKFGGCLLCMKCGSGIEIQSNFVILILILNRILIFTKTLRSDTKLVYFNFIPICWTFFDYICRALVQRTRVESFNKIKQDWSRCRYPTADAVLSSPLPLPTARSLPSKGAKERQRARERKRKTDRDCTSETL